MTGLIAAGKLPVPVACAIPAIAMSLAAALRQDVSGS
jgi:hypothetical protein